MAKRRYGGAVGDEWLAQVEERLAADDGTSALAVGLVLLASAAGRGVLVDEDEVSAAVRRAMLLLAAGGDLERGLDLNGRAVVSLADDLDSTERRDVLGSGLLEIRRRGKGYGHVSEALQALSQEPDIAWRAYACSLLASSLDTD